MFFLLNGKVFKMSDDILLGFWLIKNLEVLIVENGDFKCNLFFCFGKRIEYWEIIGVKDRI